MSRRGSITALAFLLTVVACGRRKEAPTRDPLQPISAPASVQALTPQDAYLVVRAASRNRLNRLADLAEDLWGAKLPDPLLTWAGEHADFRGLDPSRPLFGALRAGGAGSVTIAAVAPQNGASRYKLFAADDAFAQGSALASQLADADLSARVLMQRVMPGAAAASDGPGTADFGLHMQGGAIDLHAQITMRSAPRSVTSAVPAIASHLPNHFPFKMVIRHDDLLLGKQGMSLHVRTGRAVAFHSVGCAVHFAPTLKVALVMRAAPGTLTGDALAQSLVAWLTEKERASHGLHCTPLPARTAADNSTVYRLQWHGNLSRLVARPIAPLSALLPNGTAAALGHLTKGLFGEQGRTLELTAVGNTVLLAVDDEGKLLGRMREGKERHAALAEPTLAGDVRSYMRLDIRNFAHHLWIATRTQLPYVGYDFRQGDPLPLEILGVSRGAGYFVHARCNPRAISKWKESLQVR